METVIEKKQFRLDYRDILKGLLMAMIVPILIIVQSSLDQGHLEFNWKNIGIAAVAGGVSYLIKNFFTPTQTIIKAPASEVEIIAVGTPEKDSGTEQQN